MRKVETKSEENWFDIARRRVPQLAIRTYAGVANGGALAVAVGIEAARVCGRVWRLRRLHWPLPT